MSRIDKTIEGISDEPVDADEILAALHKEGVAGAPRRSDAVSCYLSASDGWKEALAVLGGAFAPSRGEENE